jgi:hypothetical protein
VISRLGLSLVGLGRLLACLIGFWSSAACAQNFFYLGGDVVADAQVVVVYWGEQMDNGVLQTRLDQFYRRLAASHYFEPLTEYAAKGKRPGRVSFVKSVQIRLNDTRTIDTVELARELDRQIASGVLPPATDSTIYMVHLGTKVRAMMGSNIFGVPFGAMAGNGFCAYHYTARVQVPTPFPLIAVFGQKIRIGVIPDQAVGNCLNGGDFFATTTSAASHELVEAIVNPDAVLIELLPVSGANAQCNGARFPAASLPFTPIPAPIAFNGIETWAWVSGLSQLCNPEEIADSFTGATNHCTGDFRYNTTGTTATGDAEGIYAVQGYFLNSLGRCSIAPNVAPPTVHTVDPVCMAGCDRKYVSCIDTANSQKDRARCVVARNNCNKTCVR